MKKYIAIVCALTLSCAIFASCGKKKDSDDKDSKASKNGDAVVTEAETDTKDDFSDVTAETTRTKAFYDSLKDKKFKLTMVTSSDEFEDSTTTVEMNGDNYHLIIEEGEVRNDLFVIDGVMYVLDYTQNVYYKDENPTEMYLNVDPAMYTMGIESDYVFVSSEKTDDGMICEKYYAPDMFTGLVATNEEDGNATVFKYFYNEDSTCPESIEYTTYDMVQTTKITDYSFEEVTIELPELKDWTDNTDAVAVDDGAAVVEEAAE
ncbi:hypothetical protein [Ruminococcus albus]|uniref:Lipoprotein n=1 Tax=Ruminococcus albus TaxID=1264 RepID=A0A1I1QJY2_RUMAL|nr:hypothetical protein [Ruminococcus albus]SFD22292.1 hypothetical protein SAMN02910406_03419 [Ruminococcus albus]